MITRLSIILLISSSLLPFLTFAQEASDNNTDIFAEKNSRKNFIFKGSLCMTVEHFHVGNTNYQFWECAPLTEATAAEFNLTKSHIGTWEQRDCPRGFIFDEEEQRCEEQRKVRRQQSLCARDPITTGCPQQCGATNSNPMLGQQCNWQTAQLQRDPQSTSYFLQCAPQANSNSCGQWVRMPCSPNTIFQQNLQICVQPQQQQQSGCPAQQAPVCGCARQNACPGTLSCAAPTNTCCGQMQQPYVPPPQPIAPYVPPQAVCPGGTTLLSGNCRSCPYLTSCLQNVGCCPRIPQLLLPAPTEAAFIIYRHSSTACPNNQAPVCGCSVGCPQQTSCYAPTQSCCTQQQPVVQPPPPVYQVTVQFTCPSGIAAQSQCNGGQCPSGSSCYNGGCCPSACPVQQQFQTFCGYNSRCPQQAQCYQPTKCCCQQQQPPRCPNGQNAVSACTTGATCGAGMECVNGGCCPLPNCPTGVPTMGRCTIEGSPCGRGGLCTSGLCCPMPMCPSGQPGVGPCVAGQCPMGNECSNGVICCPLPRCPSGAAASSRCPVNGATCGANALCQNGLCCPMPMCPNGAPAMSPCRNGQCQQGSECVNGIICCPLPQCPRGGLATARCPINGATCGANMSCQNSLCCPMPMCPNGQPGINVCSNGQCPRGSECANGVCCPLPQCPSGVPASQRCQNGALCPMGQSCQRGVCCPLPPCPNGVVPSAACTGDFQCGPGQGCTNGGCCPLPACPSGVIASQRCQQGSLCPTGQVCQNGVCCASCPNGQPPMNPCQQGCQFGFSCVANVGCCPVPPTPAPQPVCPPVQQPVCQCGIQLTCPMQSSCNVGTCCTVTTSVIAGVQPGYGCQASNQCNGYNAGCAQCVQNSCACTNSAWSNGVGCQQTNVQVMYQARSACSQAGAGCSVSFNSKKRKPVFHGNEDATNSTNFWFLVSGTRKCPTVTQLDGQSVDADASCLPNEMCIEGICTMKLWPGEYGCHSDRECSARCARGVCKANTEKNGVGQCRCRDSYLLFGKCLDECPQGTMAEGDECVLEDEDGFWKNLRMQSVIRDVLQAANC